MRRLRRRFNLQAKISFVLVAVILPTYLIVTIAENQFTRPILEEEIRQVAITSGKTLAAQIDSLRLLQLTNPTPALENQIQELVYSQPNITRIDVVVRDSVTGVVKLLASNVEEEPGSPPPVTTFGETVSSDYKPDEFGVGSWEVMVPIEHRGRDPRGPRRLLGAVHVEMSTKLVAGIVGAIWRTTFTAAAFSVVALILVLSYFLRKTIANDRKLREAESQNLELTEKLHDTQRQLMNTEKFAVMGQLTASFAHEIGTPLNAIGGHLQLLKEDIPTDQAVVERLGIIEGQLAKIVEIVKSFLQSTSKPPSQRQLVDVNRISDKTLSILKPRIDEMQVEVKKRYDRDLGPIRVVPIDLEQIFLNLMNNSLDSMQPKNTRLALEVSTELKREGNKDWAWISIWDTGEGIKKADLKNVLKPFFTTKPPGEGTGLGLTICQQLAHKYGGNLEIDSKEGAWTKVTFKFPYEVKV